jgi:hypothetical protein
MPSARGDRWSERMARSSYFQAIAPAAETPPTAPLAPTPPLFRPGAAPAAFLAIDSWNEPPREGAGGRRPAPKDRATRPDGVTPPDRPDSPVSEKPGSGDRTRLAAPIDAASAPAPRITRPASGPILPRPTIEPEPVRPPSVDAPQPTSEPERPRHGAPQPASEPERPRSSSQAAAATPAPPPAIMPQPPAPRPSAKPGPSGPAGGVHIGTLEVRVVAPAASAQAEPPQAGRPRFAVRAPALRQARGSARLSRGFAVFGLGQS